MITVDFRDFYEMMAFAKQLTGLAPAAQTVSDVTNRAEDPAPTAPPQAVTTPQTTIPTSPVSPQATIPVQAPVASTPAPVASTPAPTTAAVPTSTVSYTQDDLARAAMALMDAGRQGELQSLLQQFGVVSLPQLAPEHYGAFATALRGMGAQI